MNLLQLIFFIFCYIYNIYNIESGKIQANFAEIFGEEWDKNESVPIENREEMGTESIDQMSNNQNIIINDQNTKENPNDQQKKEIIQKFNAIKEKLRQKGKFHCEKRVKIEIKIGKLLGTNRHKIYKWKKELNLNKRKIMKKSYYEKKKSEFIERIDEFKSLDGQRKQKEIVKELGISYDTFWKWKKELLPNNNKTTNKYSNQIKARKMKQYFEVKEANPKITDEKIAKNLGIGIQTLIRWKKKFASK